MKRFHPFRDAKTELHALRYALKPHPDNSDARKAITLMLAGSWCVITIGIAFGWAVPTEMYGLLSAFVGAWVSKVQERELQRLSGENNE